MKDEVNLCRFCLSVCDNAELIQDVTRKMLNALSVEINLFAISDPAMCKNCSENIQKCFTFKSKVSSAQNCIYSLLKEASTTQLDLETIYLNKYKNMGKILECSRVCRLCMEAVCTGSFLFLNCDDKNTKVAGIMLQKYFAELDLAITKEPVICSSCCDSLESYFNFTATCFDVEQKIRKYCEVKSMNTESYVDLNHVLEFSLRNSEEHKDSCTVFEKVNVEEKYVAYQDGRDQLELKTREANIKNEKEALKTELLELSSYEENKGAHNVFDLQESKGSVAVERYTYEICGLQMNYKQNINAHMMIHEAASEVTMFKCKQCAYQTKCKDDLQKHATIHKSETKINIYKCQQCAYETRHKRYLAKHAIVHKNASEIKMYKCKQCEYQAKCMSDLRKHAIVHKDPAEVTMYRCDVCLYETKYKQYIKVHVLIHKTASDVPMFKCDLCDYETKQKKYLKSHILVHTRDAPVHKCDVCAYRTKYKADIHKHMLKHERISEDLKYKCEVCQYQARRKWSLKRHMLTHKSTSEVMMYKCETCQFESKHEHCLQAHKLTHKSTEDVVMYKCEICPHTSRYKYAMKRHIERRHKNK